MNTPTRHLSIRRILVALDASPHSLSALEAAAELAAGLEAELMGLFVEDTDLLRLAGLPFTRELDPASAALRPLDATNMERQLRARAERVRLILERTARQSHVRWSFRTARGRVAPEVLAAAAEADLVILGKSGQSPTRYRRVGSTARTVLAGAPCLTLVLRHGVRLGLPVAVAFDASDASEKALDVAARLVRDRGGALTVLVLAGEESGAAGLRSRAEARLANLEVPARFQTWIGAEAPRLARAVRAREQGILVLPVNPALLEDQALLALLNEIECPVLWVR